MANNDFSFIPTERGGEALVAYNYVFRLDNRKPDGKRYWKCRAAGCKATAITMGNDVERACTAVAHNHSSEETGIKRQQFRANLKDEVNND